jgi:hypothetical protein
LLKDAQEPEDDEKGEDAVGDELNHGVARGLVLNP